MDYSIPEEAYRRLTQGMSNVDKMIVTIQEGKKMDGRLLCYGKSCGNSLFGQRSVAAIENQYKFIRRRHNV